MEVTEAAQPQLSPTPSKKVSFAAAPHEEGASPSPPRKASPDGKAGSGASAAPGAACPQLHSNALFSPERQGSWTIEAQRSDRMEGPPAGGEAAAAPSPSPSPLPSIGLASGGGAYTPASSSWLESARKVNDLQDRLAGLEAALKEMESKAVAHLDRSLQEKVLATAAKIVQKRFMADKELDRKLQHQILQTAIKVVKRQGAAKAAAAVASPAAAAAAAPAEEPGATPTRRLEFDQARRGGWGGEAPGAAGVATYVAHIEQGLGEVVRRLEKKVDAVAAALDQNALELLEARLAGGVVQLEARLGALEERAAAQRSGTAPEGSRALLERVSAVEAAMAEQSRAVTDLLAALAAQGASQHIGAAVAAAQAQMAARRAEAEAGEQQGEQEQRGAQAAPLAKPASPKQQQQEQQERGRERQQRGRAAQVPAQREPAAQLHQRRVAAAKRSALGDPARSSSARDASPARPSPRAALPRLKTTHAAGTAQQIAMATARQQLALQAARAREEAEAESPALLSALYLFGWGVLALLGCAAVLVGMTAALVKAGRLSQSDLEFLWRK